MEFSYATTTSETDWADGVMDNVEVAGGGVVLRTQTTTRRFDVRDGVHDLVVAPDDTLYTVSTEGGVYQYDPTTETRERLLKRTDRTLAEPTAICASGNRVFVCDAADGSITALSTDLHRVVGTLGPDLTDPTAMAYADGTIYVLDDGDLVAVDRAGTASPVATDDLVAPLDIAVRDGEPYVLDDDEGGPSIRRPEAGPDADGPTRATGFEADGEAFTPSCLTILGDQPVVSGRYDDGSGHGIFVYDAATGAFDRRVALEGAATEMVAKAGDPDAQTLYVVAGESRHCRGFEEVHEYAAHPEDDRHVGTAFLRYDSGTTAIDWHRVTLDIVRSSASTQVRLRYLATDEPVLSSLDADSFDGMTDRNAAMLRNAGVETVWELASADPESLTFMAPGWTPASVASLQDRATTELATQAADEWTTSEVIDPQDVLLDDASGRYLYVAVELLGTPDASPLVDAVRAYCPRTSYLRHMPELYQEDQQSAAFLEQFLSVMETSFVDVERTIESVGEYFDPHGAPSESLSWLEGWLAADIGREWPESARRELLARAPELYRKRGTRAGLLELIRLYLRHANPSATDGTGETGPVAADDGSDYRLFFIERTDLDSIDDAVVDRQYGDFLSAGRSFAVFCDALETDEQTRMVQDIVDTERPAHVEGTVVSIEGEFALGENSFLGINTGLTSRTFAMGEASLGEDTVLTPRPGEQASDS
ncbi:phage tail protein [Haloarcula sp. S1CR25-12]|uniref:Phage tail protein n=1 Tax=Haloarcula saliterrae TaxID=2950534 RepID=A0ABU2FFI3_9EURY|nr:phage tail protein [Haloarcula sp. S1CR25-12]MDS0260496.1 phage tail protein [Haloarcula sp. S1CR25-12]